jgi:hypothetical protein
MELAGIPTQHEQHFRADRYTDGRPKPWDSPKLGEWSVQAVPFLSSYPDVWVFHQTRHPLKVIGSYLEFGLFDRVNRLGRQGAWLRQQANISGHDPLLEAVRFYVSWNARCETRRNRYLRWQVEEVTPVLIGQLCSVLRVPRRQNDIDHAFGQLPTNVNTRHNARTLEWDDLPAAPDTTALRLMADRYGYY